MEITKEEITKDVHRNYAEFEQSQLIVKLAINDEVIISVNGTSIKEYVAKYNNCHFEMNIQDKGIKREATETDRLNERIAILEKELAEELKGL